MATYLQNFRKERQIAAFQQSSVLTNCFLLGVTLFPLKVCKESYCNNEYYWLFV